jgi:hypothetical protein
MALLNKLSIAAASTAAFLTLGTFGIDPAQAALFKFSLSSEEANGYFIYETDSAPDPQYDSTPNSDVYRGAIKEYKFDLGDKGIYEGNTADPIVFLARNQYDSNVPIDKESDIFTFEVRGFDRKPESAFSFLAEFYYPKDTFEGSTELPTSVPSSVRVEIHPNVQVPDRGEPAYIGFVQTRIEKVPEPRLLPALLGVGAWFIFRRHQRQQLLSLQD